MIRPEDIDLPADYETRDELFDAMTCELDYLALSPDTRLVTLTLVMAGFSDNAKPHDQKGKRAAGSVPWWKEPMGFRDVVRTLGAAGFIWWVFAHL